MPPTRLYSSTLLVFREPHVCRKPGFIHPLFASFVNLANAANPAFNRNNKNRSGASTLLFSPSCQTLHLILYVLTIPTSAPCLLRSTPPPPAGVGGATALGALAMCTGGTANLPAAAGLVGQLAVVEAQRLDLYPATKQDSSSRTEQRAKEPTPRRMTSIGRMQGSKPTQKGRLIN